MHARTHEVRIIPLPLVDRARMTAGIARPIDFSYTVPHAPKPAVPRPQFVQNVIQQFEAGYDVVCLEAPSGYGKTTLMLELASSVREPCFATFLRPASRLSYDPVTARADLANQVYWHLTSSRFPEDEEPTDGQLRTLWSKCARRLIRQRSFAYVLVDGIHHIPPSDRTIKGAIADFLPLGLKPLRVLLSCHRERDLAIENRGLRVKSVPVFPFTAHESADFLREVVPERERQLEYHQAVGGVPVLLSSLRKQAATSPGEVDPDAYADLGSMFDTQWELVDGADRCTKKAIAFMIAYGFPVDTNTLSRHCAVDAEVVSAALASLPFVTYSKTSQGWEFSPDVLRKFAEEKLGRMVRDANEEIVTELLRRPDSVESLTRLPLYIEKSGNTESSSVGTS